MSGGLLKGWRKRKILSKKWRVKFPATNIELLFMALICILYPSHLLLLIEPPGTSYDRYVLCVHGSSSGLARMVQEKYIVAV